MAYLIQSGIHLSLDNLTWYKITDHNREPINISTELIESQSRMANGNMRKYIVSKKDKISVSWKYVPSRTDVRLDNGTIVEYLTADNNLAAGWLESFYKANAGLPIYLKVISSEYESEPLLNAVPSNASNNFKTAAQLSSLSSNTYTTAQETTALSSLSGLESLDTANETSINPDGLVMGNATGFKVYNVFMTDFSKTIINRTRLSDYVDMNIEFTEI
jgi:hypothetical protein